MGCLQSSALPPPLSASSLDIVFVDCDDTLYFNNWATLERLRDKISLFTKDRLGVEDTYAWRLYKQHGTALRGLLNEDLIPKERVEEYLHAVHDVPLEEINRDPELREMLLKLRVKMWIFTASSKEHATRCMKRVGVEDLFEGVIDCREVNLVTKHDPESFKAAMKKAGVNDPSRCMLVDDSVQNIRSAKSMGMRTCLVGLQDRETSQKIVCPEADYAINRLLEMEQVMPGLFSSQTKRFSTIAGKRFSMVAKRDLSKEDVPSKANQPQVVFVLGPPGCGKGTQCTKAKEYFDALHLSAGDLLREEQNNPNSEHGTLIAKHMKDGTIVPVEITCNLLLRAIKQSGKKRILVDGFPRSIDNLDGWNRTAHDDVNTLGVLFFDVQDDEDELVRRILERAKTSGREDDNEATLQKRFLTMKKTTLPVVNRLENELVVRRVGALDTVDQVWKNVQMSLEGWWPMDVKKSEEDGQSS